MTDNLTDYGRAVCRIYSTEDGKRVFDRLKEITQARLHLPAAGMDGVNGEHHMAAAIGCHRLIEDHIFQAIKQGEKS